MTETLKFDPDWACREGCVATEVLKEWLQYRKADQALIEQLEMALKPFAEAAEDTIDPDEKDEWDAWEHAAAMAVTLGDFRRAETVLKQKDGKDV